VKGKGYEAATQEFLEAYLGSSLEFHSRVALIDRNLTLLERLAHGENEWDVVATYKAVMPRFVLEAGDLRYVPLDAVCFIAEVKKTLSSTALSADLAKFSQIRGLESGDRWANRVHGRYSETKVLYVLLYDECGIDPRTLEQLLVDHRDDWDMLLILREGLLFLNAKRNVAALFARKEGPPEPAIVYFDNYPLVHMLMILTIMMTMPISMSTSDTWFRLLGEAQTKYR